MDDIEYLGADGSHLSYNLFAYCFNDPVNNYDPNGNLPEWLKNVADIGLNAITAVTALAIGFADKNSVTVNQKIQLSLAVYGGLNNLVNGVYYNYFSDKETDITSNSYVEKVYINRWDRLDYVKKNTKYENFNFNSWRYFSEYNCHMYAWIATGWAINENFTFLYDFAKRAETADIVDDWDKEWYVNVASVVLGLLGL